LRLKILKKLRRARLNSEFTGSYKKKCTVYEEDRHSGIAKGASGGMHVPWGAGLGSARAHFLKSFYTCFLAEISTKVCLKMRILGEKTVKIVSACSASRPPRFYSPPTIRPTTLSSSFLVVNAFYSPQKDPSNYSKCFAFASSALLHLFF